MTHRINVADGKLAIQQGTSEIPNEFPVTANPFNRISLMRHVCSALSQLFKADGLEFFYFGKIGRLVW
jgi:hypothetical protein